MTPIFITSAQVAQLLDLPSADAFLRQRARLEADTLFPQPMPTQRRPMRWKAAEVAAWIDRNGKPAVHDPAADPADLPAITQGRPHLRDIARTA